jgi:hypothetical protein
MGDMARGKISTDTFSLTASGVRAPLGAMSSRILKDVKLTKTLPTMRHGQYAIVCYDLSFAHKAAAIGSSCETGYNRQRDVNWVSGRAVEKSVALCLAITDSFSQILGMAAWFLGTSRHCARIGNQFVLL